MDPQRKGFALTPRGIIFGYKSEILIKYKRIKWTPSREGFALSSQGDKHMLLVNILENNEFLLSPWE